MCLLCLSKALSDQWTHMNPLYTAIRYSLRNIQHPNIPASQFHTTWHQKSSCAGWFSQHLAMAGRAAARTVRGHGCALPLGWHGTHVALEVGETRGEAPWIAVVTCFPTLQQKLSPLISIDLHWSPLISIASMWSNVHPVSLSLEVVSHAILMFWSPLYRWQDGQRFWFGGEVPVEFVCQDSDRNCTFSYRK